MTFMFFSTSAFDTINEKSNLCLALILVLLAMSFLYDVIVATVLFLGFLFAFLTYQHCYFEHSIVAPSVYSSVLTTDAVDVDANETYEEYDKISSVYAWDSLNDENAAEDCSETDPIENMPTEASSSFGFYLPNRGESYSYDFYTENCMFDFVDETTTHFHTNNGESLTFVFEGQDLKMVVHDWDEYTSYEHLPTKVADILAIARVELIESSLF